MNSRPPDLLSVIDQLGSTLLKVRDLLDEGARDGAVDPLNKLTVMAFTADLLDVASTASRLRFELESKIATDTSVDDCYWSLSLSLRAAAIQAFTS